MADWLAEDLERAMVTLWRIADGISAEPSKEAAIVVDHLGNNSMRERTRQAARDSAPR